jgi:hypothetical protein
LYLNKAKFINLINLCGFNNFFFWKFTTLLNNFKYNLLIIIFILIFFFKKQKIKMKTSFWWVSTGLLIYIIHYNQIFVPTQLPNSYVFFKKLNVALLNGVVNIHPWLTFTCYGFLIIISMFFNKTTNSKKFLLNNHFLKISKKWLYLLLIILSIFLGSFWSFQELSWGGWWNWDLIELLSLNFFFIISIIIHLKFYDNFKRVFLFKKIICVFIISFIIVRLNVLSSIHAFGGGVFSNFFFIKLLVLVFFVLTFIGLMSRKTNFVNKINYTNYTSYFNHHLLLIYSYICYYLVLSLTSAQDNAESSILINFFFLILYVFFFTFFKKTTKLNLKYRKIIKNFHYIFICFMFILFLLKSGYLSFIFLSEIQSLSTMCYTRTFYINSNFFYENNYYALWDDLHNQNIFHEFLWKNFNLLSECNTHYYKNKIAWLGLIFYKILYINNSVLLLIYKNLFIIVCYSMLYLLYFVFKHKKLKIN